MQRFFPTRLTMLITSIKASFITLHRRSTAMVNLSDIKPLFYAARFFGCAPHLVTDTDIFLTSSGLIYSGLWALGFVCCCCYGLLLISTEVHNGERYILVLTAVRTVLAYVCFFTDDTLTMRWNEKLRSALLQLRNFDVVVSYGQAHPTNWKVRSCCWMVVGTIIAYWIGVGYVTYKWVVFTYNLPWWDIWMSNLLVKCFTFVIYSAQSCADVNVNEVMIILYYITNRSAVLKFK